LNWRKDYAVAWQNFYHTGPVCVYLVDQAETNVIEGAIVEEQGKARTVVLEVPADAELIPQQMQEKFAVSDAGDNVDWLLEQVDVRFDLSRTRIAPLQANSRTVGIIIFELRHPAGGDISEQIGPAIKFGGAILDMLETISSQQRYAERFAAALGSGMQNTEHPTSNIEHPSFNIELPTKEVKQTATAEVLAEMAAGAAHELNNPLSVISGRAQLLAKSENDPDRKRILEQIQQNAGELSRLLTT